MNSPVILPADDAFLANSILTELLDEPTKTVTKLLILGTDEPAEKGRQYVFFLLSSHPDEYESVSFVFVPEPALILDQLKTLTIKMDSPFDWIHFPNYVVLSLSPDTNFISAFITREALSAQPSRIKLAIIDAMSNSF